MLTEGDGWGSIGDRVGEVEEKARKIYGPSFIDTLKSAGDGGGGGFTFPSVEEARQIQQMFEDQEQSFLECEAIIGRMRDVIGAEPFAPDPESVAFCQDMEDCLIRLNELNEGCIEFAAGYAKDIGTAVDAMHTTDDSVADAYNSGSRE